MSDEVASLETGRWLHPWLGYLVIASVIGILIVMFFDETGAPRCGRASCQLWSPWVLLAGAAVVEAAPQSYSGI